MLHSNPKHNILCFRRRTNFLETAHSHIKRATHYTCNHDPEDSTHCYISIPAEAFAGKFCCLVHYKGTQNEPLDAENYATINRTY